MSAFAEYVFRRCDLAAAEVAWFGSMGRLRVVPRGGVYCCIGQPHHEIGFLEEGILQVYAVSSSGRKAVLDFIFPGYPALALESALQGMPSRVCFEAVTTCALRVWAYETRQIASARDPGWDRLATRMTEEAFIRKQRRYLSLRVRNAEERYADLADELPAGWQQIPQHMLASYLDITPQYLSRIKRISNRAASLRPT